jgi:hypothetical protein
LPYLYETHLHTCQGSACGVSRGRDYISRYRDLGYTGIIVTDHFFRGNCAVDRGLPWEKRIDRFCRGYEEAGEAGARLGLDVFFGWEETHEFDDFLVYGLDKKWLKAHPEAERWTRREQFDAVNRAGGCVVHAHPFRQHAYIRKITLSPCLVNGVEAANGGNSDSAYDALAWVYAKKAGLPVTAGTDIHCVSDARPETVFGVYLDRKMETIADYAGAVRGRAIAGLKHSPGRCDFRGGPLPVLPVEIRDGEDRITGRDLQQFLDL